MHSPPGRRHPWRAALSLALALGLLRAATATADDEPHGPGSPSLAARIDLTRITIFEADYSRASRQRHEADLRSIEGEVSEMLRHEVLPYATEASAGAVRGPERLAKDFIALEGKMDKKSVKRKLSILGQLQALSKTAHHPATAPRAAGR